MSDRFFSLPGNESGKKTTGLILLAQSIFLGIFLGAFDVTAHSLFLEIFDEKIMARGYIVSGLSGIILTSLYNWLHTRMQLKNFVVINLLLVTSITLFLWFVLILSPSKWLIFVIFIMMGPLNILAMLGFWGTTRLFSTKSMKGLFALTDTGLIIGIIIVCYTIPLLLSFKFKTQNILLVSSTSVLIAAVLQVIIGMRSYQFAGSDEQLSEKPVRMRSLTAVFLENPYLRILIIFFTLSVVTAFFVQYSFMAVTRKQFPSAIDMAGFLGLFTGSMMIFTLLIKLYLFPYLIRNYGLRTSLIISPALLAILTTIILITGTIMGYGMRSTGGFIIFFVLLALSRFFSKSLKDSIESPSLNVMYKTTDTRIQNIVQSGMSGTVNEIAALLSGLILAGLGLIEIIKLIYFSWVLLIVIIVWLIVSLRLYSEFRKAITKEHGKDIKIRHEEETVPEQAIIKSRFSAERAFKLDYFRLITGDFSVLPAARNKLYYEKIVVHSAMLQDINLLPVLKKIAADKSLEEGIYKRSAEMVEMLEKLLLLNQDESRKIFNAKKILLRSRLPQTTEILKLLRDSSIESKRIAIYMIGKFSLSDMLPEVCECLSIEGLKTDAFTVLQSFGKDAEDELLRYYLVTSGNITNSILILRLLGKICTKESVGFLFSRLWSSSSLLKEIALYNLFKCEFKPSVEDKDHLNQLISEIIGLIVWNLYAKTSLQNHNDTFLLNVMQKEIKRWTEFLFNILSLTYGRESINKISENLDRETVEDISHALEMLNIIVDDSIKTKLISLLDVVPDKKKLKNLYQYFPAEIPEYNLLLDDIVNRDYNLLSLWTKACTLRNLPEFEGDNMAESVVALLFSPEEILQEESAKLVARSSMELYKTASLRIPDSIRDRLDRIVYGETDEMELLFEKVRFLSNCFNGIPEDNLLHLAGSMKFVKDIQTTLLSFPEDSIIWMLSADKQPDNVFIHYADRVNDPSEKFLNKDYAFFYVLPLNVLDEYLFQFPEKSTEIMEYIDNCEE
jgi:AAA family ATP:ADP antiporter